MKDIKQVIKERPNVNNYDLKPYGYIVALTNYADKLEEAINYSQCCKSESEQLFCQCNKPVQWTTDEGFTGCVKCNKEIKVK